MIDIKKLRKDIQHLLTRDFVATLISMLGYKIYGNNMMFKLRADERTPSAQIKANGRIVDYGSGFNGDIISVMHSYHNVSLVDATLKVANLLNIDLVRYKI